MEKFPPRLAFIILPQLHLFAQRQTHDSIFDYRADWVSHCACDCMRQRDFSTLLISYRQSKHQCVVRRTYLGTTAKILSHTIGTSAQILASFQREGAGDQGRPCSQSAHNRQRSCSSALLSCFQCHCLVVWLGGQRRHSSGAVLVLVLGDGGRACR